MIYFYVVHSSAFLVNTHLYQIKLDSSIWLQVKRPSMPTAQWFWKVNCSFSKYHSTTGYFKEDIVFLKEISQKLQFSSLGVGGYITTAVKCTNCFATPCSLGI